MRMLLKNTTMRRQALICLACSAALLLGPRALEASREFVSDCKAMAAGPHRLAGTEPLRRAADHVEKRLRRIGVDHVLVQEFSAAQTFVKRCEAIIAGPGASRRVALIPMRPNGLIPPVTPRQGVTGRIYHAGAGREEVFGDRSPAGRVVVMDYNCSTGWLRAFRLGARAVIFARRTTAQAWRPHYVDANANFLRYYYPGAAADLPEGASATIHAEIVWRSVKGRNALGYIRGTKPRFEQGSDETIVLACRLDSFGEAPRRSPGARGAANAAALLRMARHFTEHRPRRNIIVAFLDGEARGHAGAAAFYRALETSEGGVSAGSRLRSAEKEKRFVGRMAAAIRSPDFLKAPADARRELTNRLKSKAEARAYAQTDALLLMREKRAAMKRGAPGAAELDAAIKKGEGERDGWNDLRRALQRQEIPAAVRGKLDAVMKEVALDVTIRARELAAEKRELESDAALSRLVARDWICLHASLLLGDTTARWSVMAGGNAAFRSRGDNPGLYTRVLKAFLGAYDSLKKRGLAPAGFETAGVDSSLTQSASLWGAPLVTHSGAVAGKVGIYNVAVGTCQESFPREGTPDDTLSRLDAGRIEKQADEAAALLGALADSEDISLRRSIVSESQYFFYTFESDNRAHGPTVMGRSAGSSVPNMPMAGATVRINSRLKRLYAFQPIRIYAYDDFLALRTNQNGSYSFGPVRSQSRYKRLRGFAAVFDARGRVTDASTGASGAAAPGKRLETFTCRHGAVVAAPWSMDGSRIETLLKAQVINARGDGPLDETRANFDTRDGVIYWYCEDRVKRVKLFALGSATVLGNGGPFLSGSYAGLSKDNAYVGKGFPADALGTEMDVARRSACDLWRLNEGRMQILRSRDVSNSSVEELHGRAEDLLVEAGESGSVARGDSLAASAFMAAGPVYTSVRDTLDDLVHAVVALLALAAPFAFCLERLLVGATNIYRQILWFGLFFLATFLALFFTHPAFAVSNSSIIIFLGFVVVVLSGFVIVIIMRKFEVELKTLQGLGSTVHAADVSRFGTIMAAMSMGISTMRRRPLRTALTAVTIILLTFTILCFASFGVELGVIKLFVVPSPRYAGVYVHQVNWTDLSPNLLDLAQARWGREAKVCPRFWVSPRWEGQREITVTREDGSRPVEMKGLLGVSEEEIKARADLRELLGAPVADGVETLRLTEAAARRAGLRPGDFALMGGVRLRVGKLLDASLMSVTRDVDESDILPVDFVELRSAGAKDEVIEDPLAMLDRQNWTTLAADEVAVVSPRTARRLGANLYAISIYTADRRGAAAVAEDLARILPFPVSATGQDGVYRYLLGSRLLASGAGDLFFPTLLGGLVIFGAMLGSVADREKEIYSFSALGLAPPHVASLFFAEAMVYSVVGGLGGYLLAQGAMKVLGYLAGLGLLRAPEMNYSSTNAVVAIAIVMGAVLLSAVYPAIKASRSANPGILRAWRLPTPTGDRFDITFPFTVSEYDITGVVSFLKEHFDNFGDTGLGVFMARDTRLLIGDGGSIGLDSRVALAPFDLGVTQSFELYSAPSEIPGIDEVKIKIIRRSGQPKDWRRLNKALLDDLRRQFLIWRSLPHETMELYRGRTLAAMGKQP